MMRYILHVECELMTWNKLSYDDLGTCRVDVAILKLWV